LEKIRQDPPKGIILSGGPASVYEDQAPVCDKKIFKLGIPILGICYGAQLIAQVSRGKVIKTSQTEYGRVNVILDKRDDIFYGFSDSATCWMNRQDLVENIPPNFEVIARSENTKVAAMANKEKKIYRVQFHPEVSHTSLGKKLLENFLYRICQCQPSWNLESFIQQSIKDIKEKIGKGKVVAGVSGGIDSIVAAV
jgi:GMP synthase (glutamine-hydrolysing)